MHAKYAGQGMVALSVCVRLTEGDSRERALEFLKAQKAAFTNLLLDEPDSLWAEKFGIGGPPIVFVFDRQGKRAGKLDHYEDVEKLVRELLREKP